MEIRDVLYGAVLIEPHERPVLESRFFQRLRQIRQLGFAEYSYPTATHNRFVHSLGALKVATDVYETIFTPLLKRGSPQNFHAFRALVRLAALLHDVGHGPLSHTTEFAMPNLSELKLPLAHLKNVDRQATHEDYTLKILLDSELTPLLDRAGEPYGFRAFHIAALIDPTIIIDDGYFSESMPGMGLVDFRPLLQQLVSSELDADRMDYLRRDSFFAGVSYGHYDYSWLAQHLSHHFRDGRAYLALKHRALYAFEDFLLSRYHMFLMVYFHYKSTIYDEMLTRYFETAPGEYQLPAELDGYVHTHDGQLYERLAQSSNPWAKRITEKKPFKLLLEMHSGIPANSAVQKRNLERLHALKSRLEQENIPFIATTDEGELSKYYRKGGDPIYVRYDDLFHAEEFIPLEECTDLFQKYQEIRTIKRLYVAPEDLARVKEWRLLD